MNAKVLERYKGGDIKEIEREWGRDGEGREREREGEEEI